jgi:hypothetical protein
MLTGDSRQRKLWRATLVWTMSLRRLFQIKEWMSHDASPTAGLFEIARSRARSRLSVPVDVPGTARPVRT